MTWRDLHPSFFSVKIIIQVVTVSFKILRFSVTDVFRFVEWYTTTVVYHVDRSPSILRLKKIIVTVSFNQSLHDGQIPSES